MKYLVLLVFLIFCGACDEGARTCYKVCVANTNACVGNKQERKEDAHECYVLNNQCVKECSLWRKKK
jgi:hypothetical protein